MAQANASYYYRSQYELAVANETKEFDFTDIIRWFQIAIVPSATYSAGTLTLQFQPIGSSSWVNYVDSTGSAITISMASPIPVILSDFAVKNVRLVPASITDTTYTYDIYVTALADNTRSIEE